MVENFQVTRHKTGAQMEHNGAQTLFPLYSVWLQP